MILTHTSKGSASKLNEKAELRKYVYVNTTKRFC